LIIISTFGISMNSALFRTYLDCFCFCVEFCSDWSIMAVFLSMGSFLVHNNDNHRQAKLNMLRNKRFKDFVWDNNPNPKYAKIKLLMQKVNFTKLNEGMSLYLL